MSRLSACVALGLGVWTRSGGSRSGRSGRYHLGRGDNCGGHRDLECWGLHGRCYQKTKLGTLKRDLFVELKENGVLRIRKWHPRQENTVVLCSGRKAGNGWGMNVLLMVKHRLILIALHWKPQGQSKRGKYMRCKARMVDEDWMKAGKTFHSNKA
ncbi:hypothetical protein PoB_005640700 [Plakobranchus ocellatus]|uniref:Uncharacterized protein n=1 Tax=Plakobranchus ocellatus TaxID=259542 RepID=A0AAV4CEX2_9GAST|nr:hypothetical protein PoB_005640700 [Plakobranchus ocellatus]